MVQNLGMTWGDTRSPSVEKNTEIKNEFFIL